MSILPFVAIFSLFFSAIIVAFVCRIGPKINLLDMPNHRSSHLVPTLKGGGVGILLTFMIIGFFVARQYAFVITCSAIGIIGLISDLFDISSGLRLVIHIASAFILIVLTANLLHPANNITMILLMLFLVMFIAGSANIYNFMDGINGIAALTAIVAFGLLSVFSAENFGSRFPATILAVSITFASLGFLRFNMPSARIFMGDVGSVFLGFTFAGIVVLLSKNIADFICLSSFLFTFYADEVVTMCLRLKDAQNLLLPHRRHFYQILANEGKMPHWKISCGYAVAQFAIGLSILSMRPLGLRFIISTLVLYFIVFVILNFLVRRKFESIPIKK